MKNKNTTLFNKAMRIIPGGVNSPVRGFGAVGGTPLFIKKGKGAVMTDVTGAKYIDYMLSWGPLILGHADGDIVRAIKQAAGDGSSYGAPTEREIELAQLIKHFMPNAEMVRLVTSGTEATMSAIRLARAYTKRDVIIKFDGCYHGHADYLLVEAGSGGATFGNPNSPGVPRSFVKHTLSLPYNDMRCLKKVFRTHNKRIAAVIIEPVAGNMGVVPAKATFLQYLRKACDRTGALLIFDEVMTGFRVDLGGAQKYFGIKPDLTALGKVIGGGLPIGAYAGRRNIMSLVSPQGPVYQAGTLSGNPVAVSAGLACLKKLKGGKDFADAENACREIVNGFEDVTKKQQLPISLNAMGTMFTLFFLPKAPENISQVEKSDAKLFSKYFHFFLQKGIYWPPSLYEAAFTSCCHRQREINKTIDVFKKFTRKYF